MKKHSVRILRIHQQEYTFVKMRGYCDRDRLGVCLDAAEQNRNVGPGEAGSVSFSLNATPRRDRAVAAMYCAYSLGVANVRATGAARNVVGIIIGIISEKLIIADYAASSIG